MPYPKLFYKPALAGGFPQFDLSAILKYRHGISQFILESRKNSTVLNKNESRTMQDNFCDIVYLSYRVNTI